MAEDKVPNLFVIGAQKCGTTSLHEYLDVHPEVSMSAEKEPNFYLWHWERGPGWWETQFGPAARIRGESSTDYSVHPMAPGVPERIREASPDARFIYLIRDPVDRLVSQYVHNQAKGIERRPPEEFLVPEALDGSDLVLRGLYAQQLERYLEVFPEERVLVLEQDELRGDRRATLSSVFSFLGVDPGFWSPGYDEVHHESSAKTRPRAIARYVPDRVARRASRWLTEPLQRPDLDAETRARLEGLFAADTERLRALTGRRLAGWPGG